MADTWIMKGLSWDNPLRIRSAAELTAWVDQIGFLPFFANGVAGFSAEEHVAASAWWTGNRATDPWEWREAIAAAHAVAYGKFFDGRAGFISPRWLPRFANARRNGWDFDGKWQSGAASQREIFTDAIYPGVYIDGVHVGGMSRAEALFDATKIDTAPLLGASITGFALETVGETVSAAPYRSPVLTGETVLRLWAIDSRGQRHGESRTVTPLAYAPPTLSLVQVFRCDDAGSPDENGTAIGVSAQLDYSSLGGENRCSLSAALRAPEGQFGPETAMASGALTVIPGQNPDASCECRISATDSLGRSATALRRLPTRRWAMKFRPDGQGVAFGKAPEQTRCLELPGDWQIRLGQESLWLALHPVGSLVLADSAPAEGSWSDQGAVSGTRLWRRTT